MRNLSKCDSPAPIVHPVQSCTERSRQRLEKWKEEKEKKKKEAASKKKEPFLTGVPHPPLQYVPPPCKPSAKQARKPSTSGRVTRSQSANTTKPKETKDSSKSIAPIDASFRPPEIKTMSELPIWTPNNKQAKKHNITFDPVLPTTEKETSKQTNKQTGWQQAVKQAQTETNAVRKQTERPKKGKVTKPAPPTNKVKITPLQSSSSSEIEQNIAFSPNLASKNFRKSLPPQKSPRITTNTRWKYVKNITPNRPVPRSESSSEERLRSPKSLDYYALTPEQIVEEAKKISPCVTMSHGKDNARKEMKKKLDEGLLDEDASNIDSVDHFRRQLASEIKRMSEMCDTWDKILEQTVLSESVQEAVLSAVGQARLLMSSMMQQFASLVERCARPEPGSALITPEDLLGVWDMVFMQVENVVMRFKKLEELRLCGWVEEQPIELQKKVVKKAAKPTGGPGRLRETNAAARKAKMEQEEATTTATTLQPPSGDSKTFEAGVRSPASASASLSPSSRTPGSKAVLACEANKAPAKKKPTSFAMLRASVFGKNVECDDHFFLPQTPDPMTPINLYATPGRSTNTGKKSSKKSIKMVLFSRAETDSGVSSMELDKVEIKDSSPVVTRSMNTTQDADHDAATPRRSSREKVLHESEDDV